MSEPVVAIVVAAGSGVRLGADRPKALVDLDGVSLLRHAAQHLIAGGVTHLVVVAPDDQLRACGSQVVALGVPFALTVGGARRQESVAAGLRELRRWDEARDASVVLVHDAARPLVPATVTAAVIAAVRDGHGAVVPALAVVDSIRRLDGDGSQVVDRARLRAVQTPQGFDAALLHRAHEHLANLDVEVTDDAAACELIGAQVLLVDGSSDSLKVTTPIDLVIAQTVLERQRAERADKAEQGVQ